MKSTPSTSAVSAKTRMNYLPKSSDDPDLVKGTFEQAYISPLSSVFADYVYNSLLTGRPYFLQMMDDIKIATSSSIAKTLTPLHLLSPPQAMHTR